MQTYGYQKSVEMKSVPGIAAKQPTLDQEQLVQTHVHEFTGSTMLAEECDDRHNHRFAGVTSQVIPFDGSHIHGLFVSTDFFDNHHHEVVALTGLPRDVGENKHVHFVDAFTTMDDGHFHELIFATLILNPLLFET